jgi:hypothetical protein
VEISVAKQSETFSAASYTAHYEGSPDAVMVRIAPHRYVNDTFLKTSGGLLASRHGDEPGVKLKANGKRK